MESMTTNLRYLCGSRASCQIWLCCSHKILHTENLHNQSH